LGWLLLGGLATSASACAGEETGTVQIYYHLQETPLGPAQSCDALGAAALEIWLFEHETDLLPYEVATFSCDATGTGRASVAFDVAVGTYDRVEARLLTANGTVLQICAAEGRQPAIYELPPLRIRRAIPQAHAVSVVGTRTCAE
jgi:hypothetical protein